MSNLVRMLRTSARGVLVDSTGALVLMRRVRDGSTYCTTIGGGVEAADRSFEDAMRREVFEEAGAVVGSASLVYVSTSPDLVQYFFLAPIISLNWAARTGEEYAADTDPSAYSLFRATWDASLAELDLRPNDLCDYLVSNRDGLIRLL